MITKTQLPDTFKDFASSQVAGGKAPGPAFITHCYRELTHEQWKILLDDEFLEAWEHGIVIMCWDGVRRRFYPRIFAYSADYPEKCVSCPLVLPILIEDTSHRILMASIRNLGTCPCPRCHIPLNQVHNMGKPSDMLRRNSLARVDDNTRRGDINSARRLIYQQNYQVNSAAVERILRPNSLVPTVVRCNVSLILCWLHVDFFWDLECVLRQALTSRI